MKPSKSSPWIAILILLSVLAVIVALTYPAFDHALMSAKRSRAKNDVLQIATAVTAFHTEYGRLPSMNGDVQDVDGAVLKALMGLEPTINPRNIVFLEVQPATWSRPLSGGLYKGAYVDPWGSPYKIKLDTDGDELLTDVGASAKDKVRKRAAVWSDPFTHSNNVSETQRERSAVNSWD